MLARYGYGEIRTPMFEDYELFARTSGEASEVVQKEMYRFKDLADRDLALRPESTAGVWHAYLEQGLGGRSRVHRLWYMGPMFRYGRPQKGRYRQFHQIGAELIGSAAPGADVEMITLFVDVFEAWGFKDLVVAVNSVGTPDTRRAYAEALRSWLAPARGRLSVDSQQRLEVNPLRVLDTKDEDDLRLLHGGELGRLPHMLDHEVHDRTLGAQSALGGGGRYDGLIEALGGPPTPGVGFSIGMDRALMVLEQRGEGAPAGTAGVFVIAMDATRPAAARLVRELRHEFAVEWDVEAKGFGQQMKIAGKSGARLALILGEDEWAQGQVGLKDLITGEQRTVRREAVAEELRAGLAAAAEAAPKRGA